MREHVHISMVIDINMLFKGFTFARYYGGDRITMTTHKTITANRSHRNFEATLIRNISWILCVGQRELTVCIALKDSILLILE